MQTGLSTLASSISSVKDAKEERSSKSKRREELYAVGSRIKYLVDTPEMIWGCLDTEAYLEAAYRFLRSV